MEFDVNRAYKKLEEKQSKNKTPAQAAISGTKLKQNTVNDSTGVTTRASSSPEKFDINRAYAALAKKHPRDTSGITFNQTQAYRRRVTNAPSPTDYDSYAKQKERRERSLKQMEGELAELKRKQPASVQFTDRDSALKAENEWKQKIGMMEAGLQAAREENSRFNGTFFKSQLPGTQELTKVYQEANDPNSQFNVAVRTANEKYGTKSLDELTFNLIKDLGFIGNAPEESPVVQMTDEEKGAALYLKNKYGVEAAKDYYKAIEGELLARRRTVKEAEAQQFATEHPFAANLQTAVQAPVRGMVNAGYYLTNAVQGKAMDQNSGWLDMANYSRDVRNQTSQNILGKYTDENGNVAKSGKVANWLYQTGMSMADSAANLALAPLTGGSTVASEVSMFGNAAADTYIELKEQGIDDERAMETAGAAGVFEALFEKFSLDNVIKIAKGTGAKTTLVNMLKQSGIEGSEEMFTEIANILTETAVLGEDSEYKKLIAEYKKNGATEEEATAKALGQMTLRVLEAGLGGFVSGGVFGAGGTVMGTYSTGINAKATGNTQEVINEGLRQNTESNAYKQATKNAQKEAVGSWALGRQVIANEAARETATENAANLSDNLTQNGMDKKTADAIQEAVMKVAANEQLSKSEAASIYNSEEGYKAAADLAGLKARPETASDFRTEVNAISKTNAGKALTKGGQIVYIRNKFLDGEGNVKARLNDGRILDISEIRTTQGEQEVFAEAKRMQEAFPQQLVNEFINSYHGENFNRYRAEFALAYVAGTTGSELPGELKHMRKAYEAGREAGPMLEYDEQTELTGETITEETEGEENGTALPDGGQKRNDRNHTDEQIRQLGESAKRRNTAGSEQSRAALARKNQGKDLRKVSTAEAGVQTGTDRKQIQIIPEEQYDEELRKASEWAKKETGLDVVFTIGAMEVKDEKGGIHSIRGVWNGERIYVQADHMTYTAEQLTRHEVYHYNAKMSIGMNFEAKQRIIAEYGEDAFDGISAKYLEMYRGIIDPESENALDYILEEILADAYAKMNAFGAHAEQFNEIVQGVVDEYAPSAETETRETRGPPEERYSANGNGYDGYSMSNNARDAYENGEITEEETAELERMVADAAKETTGTHITADMTDDERTALLKDKKVIAPIYEGQADATIEDNKNKLESEKVQLKKSAIEAIAEEFNAFDNYNIKDIELVVSFSRNNARISAQHQITDIQQLAKLMPLLKQSVETSIGLEEHNNRYFFDNETLLFRNTLGAYIDNGNIVPVRFGIKTGRNGKSVLYAVISESIIKEADVKKVESRISAPHISRSATYNITDILSKVNDKDILRYAPDGMISEEQRKLKYEAIAETIKYTNDKNDRKYYKAIKSGNMDRVREIVKTAARNAGYKELWYHGSKKKGITKFKDWQYFTKNKQYAERYTDRNTGELYTVFVKYDNPFDTREPKTKAVFDKIQKSEGLTPLSNLESGLPDWTDGYDLSDYIEENGLDYDAILLDEGGDIIDNKPVSRGISYVIRDSSQIKSADPVTYDDNGNIIPLSERFNTENKDIRYSAEEPGQAERIRDEIARLTSQENKYDLWSSGGETALRENTKAVEKLQERLGSRLEDETAEILQNRKATKEQKLNAIEKEIARKDSDEYKQQLLEYGGEETALKANETKIKELRTRAEKIKGEYTPKQKEQKNIEIPEQKPTIAKKQLRTTLTGLFSIPDGSIGNANALIDTFADKMLEAKKLTNKAKQYLFDRLYSEGYIEVEAPEYYKNIREDLKGGKIYVSTAIKKELGDDWKAFKRKAFGAGIYLTSDKSKPNVEQWNAEMAELHPGFFDAEETDLRRALENIVNLAEEGKSEGMTLEEYARYAEGEDIITEADYLDQLDEKMEEALKLFAEKAGLEIALKKQTALEVAKERIKWREGMENRRKWTEEREMQKKTLKALQWLSQNRDKAPNELKEKFEEVLSDIDIYALGIADSMRWDRRNRATWGDIVEMYKYAKENDPNFAAAATKDLEYKMARLENRKIEDMDIGALRDLYTTAVQLRTEFENARKLIEDERMRLIADVGEASIKELESVEKSYITKEKGWSFKKIADLQQLTPMNNAQRIVGWNPDAQFLDMVKMIEAGERAVRAYKIEAQKQLQSFIKENAEWLTKADGQGKNGIWYESMVAPLISYDVKEGAKYGAPVKVEYTPLQKVHMYLESKNVDNLYHMAGGRTFADRKLYSEGDKGNAFNGKPIRLSPEVVEDLVSNLTPQEQKLADILANYYNVFAKEKINEVSNKLYGYDKAMGSFYAPIFVDKGFVSQEIGVFNATAEGVGNLKQRVKSTKPSYNISALEAFNINMNQTARFVGMAIPVRNWNAFMNFNDGETTVRRMLDAKWGNPVGEYFDDIVAKLQGGEKTEKSAPQRLLDKVRSNYIASVFGGNPKIVAKQFGSAALGMAYLGPEYKPRGRQLRQIDTNLISKYTQDLESRKLGYGMIEVKQLRDQPGLGEKIIGGKNPYSKRGKFGRFVAGGGAITVTDYWTAATLWPMAENKVRAEYPELEVGTQEQINKGESPFYRKVAEVFNDAVARTQSVSDELHTSTLRKNKDIVSISLTMFKSDSAQLYNLLRQTTGELNYYKSIEADKKTIKAAKKKRRDVIKAGLINGVWGQTVNLLVDLLVAAAAHYIGDDDDDDEAFLDDWMSVSKKAIFDMFEEMAGAFVGLDLIVNAIETWIDGGSPADLLEIQDIEEFNDIIEKGYDIGGEIFGSAEDAIEIIGKDGDLAEYAKTHSGDLLGAARDFAKLLGQVTGVPVANIEKYTRGIVRAFSPETATRYDDLFLSESKSDLKNLNGGSLEQRVMDLLDMRADGVERETADEIARLYKAGETKAVPSDTPKKITIDGEEVEFDAYDQQVYDVAWREAVGNGLNEIVKSSAYKKANDEDKAKMIAKLYDFAAAKGKQAVTSEYDVPNWVEDLNEVIEAGVPEETQYKLISAWSDSSNAEKYMTIAEMPYDEETKEIALEAIMEPSAFEKYKQARDAGVSTYNYCTFKMNTKDLKADYDANGNSISGSKKVKVLDEIDKMPISKAEKDALYLTEYSPKTINQAPWR